MNEANIRWNVQGDAKVTASNEKIAKSVDKVADAEVRATRAATARFKAQNKDSQDALRTAGRALGGPVGGVIGRAGGAVGAPSAALAALGGAALGLTGAFKMLIAASDRAAAAAMKEAEIRVSVGSAIKSAVKSADSSATGSFTSNRDAVTALLATGGQGLLDQGMSASQTLGPGGLKAFSTLATSKGGASQERLRALQAAVSTGRVSAEKAADLMASGSVAGGAPNVMAASILSQSTDRFTSEADVRSMQSNMVGTSAGRRVMDFDRANADVTAAGIGRFAGGDTILSDIRDSLRALNDPEGAGRRIAGESVSKQLAVLAAGSDAEYAMVGLLRDIVGLFGGSGSYTTQYNQLRTAGDQAGTN